MSSADARSAISYPTRCASTSPPTGCITRGLMVKSLFTKILGSRFKRELKRLRPVVDGILRHEERLKVLSDAEIQAQTPKLRAAIAQRTTALVAEVERLKREKHDCPDAGQRAALSDQLARAERSEERRVGKGGWSGRWGYVDGSMSKQERRRRIAV